MKSLDAFKTIKEVELSHLDYDQDENLDGDWEYTPYEADDGSIEDNYPEECKVVENHLKAMNILKELHVINLIVRGKSHYLLINGKHIDITEEQAKIFDEVFYNE